MEGADRYRVVRWVRWWWLRRHTVVDLAIAVVAWPPSLGLAVTAFGGGLPVTLLLSVPLVTGLSVAAYFRRSHPVVFFAVAMLAAVTTANVPAVMFALYTYPAWRPDRATLAVLTAVAGIAAVSVDAWYVANTPAALVIRLVMFVLSPVLLGLWIGTRRQLVDNLRERAERLEREQHLQAERAIVSERTRIAREMHDVVAHRVSLMVLHAGGLEVSAPDGRTAETAALIRTTGREALTELRHILGVLRADADGPPLAPQPTIADVARLVEASRQAGVDVAYEVRGEPGAAADAVERTAYRVVQEGLTNAAKHAPGAAVRVTVAYRAGAVAVTVANGPPGPRTAPPLPSGGHGLVGLRERAALIGGALSAGPEPGGAGWRLTAELPLNLPEHDSEG
ncbi:sensor histidine kinase [Allonocardiopsis opalescens]|uniref:histidine kinase n=1 Tax=Allonocardiopsis opalescens TaxID=1144618 RepID=A0A2T0Q459_9ACTN|nr:histidine kinase [Allonocardiopsis opalescens]PRX98586.1 signal transduction histidine kinase [Allonocardiopsis opalescens]